MFLSNEKNCIILLFMVDGNELNVFIDSVNGLFTALFVLIDEKCVFFCFCFITVHLVVKNNWYFIILYVFVYFVKILSYVLLVEIYIEHLFGFSRVF